MDVKLRAAQNKILKVFSKGAKGFALSGGTALELYYLHHRFSADLDFFSPKYDVGEIDRLVSEFEKDNKCKIKMGSEFVAPSRAKVRFYHVPIKGTNRALKIDFVEDVLFRKPTIKRFNKVPVYSIEDIYVQKLAAVGGTRVEVDEVGREIPQGRRETARDAFDIYMLSKRIKPLHVFLQGVSQQLQRGVIHWYRTFSRHELKLALHDLDIYDKKFDGREMIIYLEKEIKRFMEEVTE